jgi:hypothetical protein
MTTINVSQVEAEVITVSTTAGVRTSQVEAEVLTRSTSAQVQVSQVFAEVLCTWTADAPLTPAGDYRMLPWIT